MPFMFIEPMDCGGLVCDCGEGNPESVPSVVAEQGHGRKGLQRISEFSAAKAPETNEVAAQDPNWSTLCASRRLLTVMGCDFDASLAFFREHGGYCDCEVLFNVDQR